MNASSRRLIDARKKARLGLAHIAANIENGIENLRSHEIDQLCPATCAYAQATGLNYFDALKKFPLTPVQAQRFGFEATEKFPATMLTQAFKMELAAIDESAAAAA